MRNPRHRRGLMVVFAATAFLALGLATVAVRPRLERAVRARIVSEAARRGVVVRIDDVRVGVWPPVRLRGASLELNRSWRMSAESVEAWWPGRTRIVVDHATLQGPAGLTVGAPSTAWDIVGLAGDDFRATLVRPQRGLIVIRGVGPHGETAWTVEADDLPIGRLLDVRRFDRPLLDGGTMRGSLRLTKAARVVDFDLDLQARAARLPGLAGDGSDEGTLGEPTAAALQVAGSWRRDAGTLNVPRWSATVQGAALSGSLALGHLDTDPDVDLVLDVQRVEFAPLLRTSGLQIPESLRPEAGEGHADGLGAATLAARARGRIADPASFVVTQKLDFTPPPRLPAAIRKLRGDFVHEVTLETGGTRTIDVSPSSPDFIPIAEAPPLFLRALLIAEDAGFYTHPGIDLREVPAAILTNWARGGAARGASTITQQLAKNLFLSHEKQLGRKLQELSLTLLLEAALGKSRILEIYVNVIQWGPGLYGLRPAAHAYFAREPGELTPAQIAFLVSLIPGPLKYQSSFAHGTPGPGFRQLMDAILAKLRSVGALTEEEYQQALGEEIVVQGRDGHVTAGG